MTAPAKRSAAWRLWAWLCLGVGLGVFAVNLWPRPWLAQLLGGLGAFAVSLSAWHHWRLLRQRFEREERE